MSGRLFTEPYSAGALPGVRPKTPKPNHPRAKSVDPEMKIDILKTLMEDKLQSVRRAMFEPDCDAMNTMRYSTMIECYTEVLKWIR